jgi:hypothetical protein
MKKEIDRIVTRLNGTKFYMGMPFNKAKINKLGSILFFYEMDKLTSKYPFKDIKDTDLTEMYIEDFL